MAVIAHAFDSVRIADASASESAPPETATSTTSPASSRARCGFTALRIATMASVIGEG